MGRIMALGFAAALPWACGGEAIISGGGGSAGSSTTSSSTTTSSTTGSTTTTPAGTGAGTGAGTSTGTPGCEPLYDEYVAALAQAQACDTCDPGPVDPCDHTAQPLTDPCGCAVPINAYAPDAVAAAVQAYLLWVDAGCGPYECGMPCVISHPPQCSPVTGGSGCDGMCVY